MVYYEFLPPYQTVNEGYYFNVARHFRETIPQKRRNSWKDSSRFLHYNNVVLYLRKYISFLIKLLHNTVSKKFPEFCYEIKNLIYFSKYIWWSSPTEIIHLFQRSFQSSKHIQCTIAHCIDFRWAFCQKCDKYRKKYLNGFQETSKKLLCGVLRGLEKTLE